MMAALLQKADVVRTRVIWEGPEGRSGPTSAIMVGSGPSATGI